MASYSNAKKENISASFITHGEIPTDEFFIVPKGYTINVFARSGKSLLVNDMISEYYKTDETHLKHTFNEGDVIRNVKMIREPFFNTFNIGSLNMITYIPYLGPLPTVVKYRKLLSGEKKLHSDIFSYPVFYNLSDEENKTSSEIYQKYFTIYTYLYNQNLFYLMNDEEHQKTLNDFISYHSSESNTSTNRYVNAIKNNYEKYKNEFFNIYNNKTEIDKVINDVNTKNRFSSIIFEKISQSPESLVKLSNMFDKADQYISMLDVINEVKPGTYNFYLCRVFTRDLELNISKNTITGRLTRQTSVNNQNNRRLTQKNNKPKSKILSTSPYFTNFGGNNGKFVLIARFYENIVKKYFESKYRNIIAKIFDFELIDKTCQKFAFYHNLFLQCTLLDINCKQSAITTLDMGNKITFRIDDKHCELFDPELNAERIKREHKLKSSNPISRVYKYMIRHNIETNIIEYAPVKPPILNITRIHSINNVIIIVYAFIKNILLNPIFIDELNKQKKTENPKLVEELIDLFSIETLSKSLLINTDMNIIDFFNNQYKIYKKQYLEFPKRNITK